MLKLVKGKKTKERTVNALLPWSVSTVKCLTSPVLRKLCSLVTWKYFMHTRRVCKLGIYMRQTESCFKNLSAPVQLHNDGMSKLSVWRRQSCLPQPEVLWFFLFRPRESVNSGCFCPSTPEVASITLLSSAHSGTLYPDTVVCWVEGVSDWLFLLKHFCVSILLCTIH